MTRLRACLARDGAGAARRGDRRAGAAGDDVLPLVGLQSLNRKAAPIYSHTIDAFGDVSFVEAADLPGRRRRDRAAVRACRGPRVPHAGRRRDHRAGRRRLGGAVDLLPRLRPARTGNGYPVGVEWGIFLALVAAGALAYAGWRMRAAAHHGRTPPLTRRGRARRRARATRPVRLATPAPGRAALARRGSPARGRAAADPAAPAGQPVPGILRPGPSAGTRIPCRRAELAGADRHRHEGVRPDGPRTAAAYHCV